MSALFIKLTPSEVANGNGRDVVSIADGLITIRAVRVGKGRVHLLIIAPEDIDIQRGDVISKETASDKVG